MLSFVAMLNFLQNENYTTVFSVAKASVGLCVLVYLFIYLNLSPDGLPCFCCIAGMDFHELLDIPHGDRRKYHDDVSVMVISLEGRIWRSSG